MKSSVRGFDINALAPKLDVDNRLSLRFYYRTAENLLKQAGIYREEKNVVDLYIMLLRFSSLLYDTIRFHEDYPVLLPKERLTFNKKLSDVINELETLKPIVQRQVDEMNRAHMAPRDIQGMPLYSSVESVDRPSTKRQSSQYLKNGPHGAKSITSTPLFKYDNDHKENATLDGKQFLKLSLTLSRPKEETLSRHSILGPSGLQGQLNKPVTGTRIQYPSNIDLSLTDLPSLSQPSDFDLKSGRDDPAESTDEMASVLSLDDGRWSQSSTDVTTDFLQLNIRQPSPPPVLAHVQQKQGFTSIPPALVADPRPGPAKISGDGMPNSETYQHLHIPIQMLDSFLRIAELNTAKNLETCGVLAGSLKNRIFCVTTLIIPKQEATSDSCQTTNEEEIFDFQDKRALFPLGWIHTHPTQTCFMSSVDLHTHYSYQIMLPEAIAIVMAPTDESRRHGIFHLSDPGGVSVIRNCEQRGFHPHEEPSDGSPLYEHCSHVYMNPRLKFEVADLR